MKVKRAILMFFAAVIVIGILGLCALYKMYRHFLDVYAGGTVAVTSQAVDHGDYVALRVRVANSDTTRYLSNFYLNFVYEPGAYTALLTNIVPKMDFSNEFYRRKPDQMPDAQAIVLDPEFAITLGQSFLADFTVLKHSTCTTAYLYTSVSYRGQRYLDGTVLPSDYSSVQYKIAPESALTNSLHKRTIR